MSKIQIDVPEGLRTGQFIFGFLEWLSMEKNVSLGRNSLMADPFYIGNQEFDSYLKDYLSYQDEQRTASVQESGESAEEKTEISSEDEGPARESAPASPDSTEKEPEVPGSETGEKQEG